MGKQGGKLGKRKTKKTNEENGTSMIRACQAKTEIPLHLEEFPEAP
jgi:hypothetical protein